MTLASPCIGVCRLDPAQTHCTGCGRSWGEIGEWTVASEARQRDAIRTAFFDGVTYAELAERQSIPLGTMKSWVRRGLAKLKECLEG